MSDFKSRLITEETQLKEKIGKLHDFTQSDKFENASQFQRSILGIQLEAMRTYYRCLVERLSTL